MRPYLLILSKDDFSPKTPGKMYNPFFFRGHDIIYDDLYKNKKK